MKTTKIIALLFCLTLVSCVKDELVPIKQAPSGTISSTCGYQEVTLSWEVSSKLEDYERLTIEYSTSPNYNNSTSIQCPKDILSYHITNLEPATTYYVRFVWDNHINKKQIDSFSFTTKHYDGFDNGYAYVDLGLSVMWASQSQEGYVAWGDIYSKTTQYEENKYRFYDKNLYITKYCFNSNEGTIDNKLILDAEDDYLSVKWNGNWRIPTKREWEELISQCTCTEIKYPFYGYRFTAKNGNYIDLRANGYISSSSKKTDGSQCYYWSSSLNHLESSKTAVCMICNSKGASMYYGDRYLGLSVCGVRSPEGIKQPELKTLEATDVGGTFANVGGEIISLQNARIIERGICYGYESDPIERINKVIDSTQSSVFTCQLSALVPNSQFYARAYVISDVGINYGQTISFTTKSSEAKIDAHHGIAPVTSDARTSCEWVQLWEGGPKWAAFNVGSEIKSYGCLYLGKEDEHELYNTSNVGGLYEYDRGGYRNARTSRWTQGDISNYRPGTDEIVRTMWGNNWTNPTKDDIAILSNPSYTTLEWCDGRNNQYMPGCTLTGLKVSGLGEYSDASIFLPCGGRYYPYYTHNGKTDWTIGGLQSIGIAGDYWLDDGGGNYEAYYFLFYKNDELIYKRDYEYKYIGNSVRPILVE